MDRLGKANLETAMEIRRDHKINLSCVSAAIWGVLSIPALLYPTPVVVSGSRHP